MGIMDDDIRRVREESDIIRLITQHTQLKKVGRSWKGLCPFHNEKTPSFTVNQENGRNFPQIEKWNFSLSGKSQSDWTSVCE